MIDWKLARRVAKMVAGTQPSVRLTNVLPGLAA
jgi:hypothetical protein